jgi:SpoVK/Ycf46/Vps4 family AAA+-type ATPase
MQEHKAPVFLAATANDIDSLPPELMRKGRFDEIFFVDLPSEDARREIFKIHLTRKKRDPAKFDVERLVTASAGYTGAEIEQGIQGALHAAFGAKREVSTDDIAAALAGSPPLSVTRAEQIAELREWAEGRCVPAE